MAWAAVGAAAAASEPFTNAGIVLLQPDDVLRRRVKDSHALARYMKDMEPRMTTVLQAAFQRRPVGGFVVVALRPGGRSRVWLDLDDTMPQPTQDALRAAVESMPPPDIIEGVVVFALRASFWGGRPPTRSGPAPQAWRDAAARAGRKLEVGELVEQVWRD